MSNILVTGGSGFIGHALVERLCEEHSVTVLDRVPHQFPVGVAFINGDLGGCRKLLEGKVFHGVVNLAAVSGVGAGDRNPSECFRVNVRGLSSLLQLIDGDTWILHLGSLEEGKNIYGASKTVGEYLVREHTKTYGTKGLVIRFPTVYGTGQSKEKVVSQFIRRALDDEPIEIRTTESIGFLYIDDAVDCLLMGVRKLEVVNSPWYSELDVVAKKTTLKELSDKITSKLRSKSIVTLDTQSKREQALEFVPKVSVDEGLDRMVKWLVR